jgi:hypothetical protein
MPGVSDTHNPSWMSFAPAARAEPAPLTATPDANSGGRSAAVPVPRPKPKAATRTAAKTAAAKTAAKTAAKPAVGAAKRKPQ